MGHTDQRSVNGVAVRRDWRGGLVVRLLRSGEEARWRELMAAQHYLGDVPPIGQCLRYVATVDEHWVALLSWGPAAWRCGPREWWLGSGHAAPPTAPGRQQHALPDFERDPDPQPRLRGPGGQHAALGGGLAPGARPSAVAGGDVCRPEPLPRHCLSRCGLAVPGPDPRVRPQRRPLRPSWSTQGPLGAAAGAGRADQAGRPVERPAARGRWLGAQAQLRGVELDRSRWPARALGPTR